MVYGGASRPFLYRTLLPTTVRLTAALVPETARQHAILAAQGNFILGFAFILRFLLRRFYAYPAWVA